MPKATPELRQANAAKRALMTIDNLSPAEEEEDIELQTSEVTAPEVEEKQEKPKPNGREKKALAVAAVSTELDRKRGPSEDFFDYINRVAPEDWSNSQTSGLYIYKRSPKGNVRVNDEPLRGPITLQQFREEYLPVFGDGNYRLQFTTGLKYLTSCGENVTFDGQTVSLGGTSTGIISRSSVSNADQGFSDAIKATSEILKDGAKAAVDVSRVQQMDQAKGLDVAALLTGLAGFMPKPDNTMVQFLIADSQRRAEAAEKRAEEQHRRDKEDADRRERLAKEEAERRDRDRKDELDRREREWKDRQDRDNKFWELMLKEKEKKDEMGLGGIIKDLVVPLVKERFEGGGSPEGWAGVASNLADRLPDVVAGVSAMMAARNGATPAQVQQMVAPQPQLPPQQQVQGPQADFAELMKRIARYLSRDSALWNTEDGRDYILGMIEEEYAGIRQDLFVNQPQEVIYQAIQADPYGANILAHEIAKGFLESIVDAIKAEETGEVTEAAEEPEPDEEARKPNGRHKKAAPAA